MNAYMYICTWVYVHLHLSCIKPVFADVTHRLCSGRDGAASTRSTTTTTASTAWCARRRRQVALSCASTCGPFTRSANRCAARSARSSSSGRRRCRRMRASATATAGNRHYWLVHTRTHTSASCRHRSVRDILGDCCCPTASVYLLLLPLSLSSLVVVIADLVTEFTKFVSY